MTNLYIVISTVIISSFDNGLNRLNRYNGLILILSFTYPEHIFDMESTRLMPIKKKFDVGKINSIMKIVNFMFLRFGSQRYI